MVPARKLPEPSLRTIACGVFEAVAESNVAPSAATSRPSTVPPTVILPVVDIEVKSVRSRTKVEPVTVAIRISFL